MSFSIWCYKNNLEQLWLSFQVTVKEYAEIKQDGTKIVLFHYPLEEWNGFYRGSVHIHGHQHNKQEYNVKQQKLNLKRYDAGVDANNYAPVSLEHIL